MSATPEPQQDIPQPPGALPTLDYCQWISGREDRLLGNPPHLPNVAPYMDGYLEAAAHIEAAKPKATSSGTITINASEPANITDIRDTALNLIELRILKTETQLASIAAAVRKLSDAALHVREPSISDAIFQIAERVSEMEHQLRGITAVSKCEPDQSTVQSVAASSPEFELKILAADIWSFAKRFRYNHRESWGHADSAADAITSFADNIDSLSHNFQKLDKANERTQ